MTTPYPAGQLCVVTDECPLPHARGSIVERVGPPERANRHNAHVVAGYIRVGELLQWCAVIWAPHAIRKAGYVPEKWLRPIQDPDAEPIVEPIKEELPA